MQIRNAQIPSTTDYSIFEMNPLNRELHENPVLERSMQQHGFLVSKAIHVRRLANGKLSVISGHHRLHYAKRLGLPVYYIVEDVDVDLFELEGQKQDWSLADFAFARANSGDKDCMALMRWAKENQIPLIVSAALLAGENASSPHAYSRIRTGGFKLGDPTHANDMLSIVERLRAVGFEYANNRLFLCAISACLRVPEFNPDHLVKKIELYPKIIKRRTTYGQFLEEIEYAYNYGVKNGGGRIPLLFRAREVASNRQKAFFGRKAEQFTQKPSETDKK